MTSDVSIYVPAFNAENTIDKCLNSIFKQTICPDQVLVINDCSTDKGLGLLHKYHIHR